MQKNIFVPEHIVHPFSPFFCEDSCVLIVGSLPSVKSRKNGFYYGHPQNRFWKVLAAVLSCRIPQTIQEKKEMLLSHGIALWDVIAECDIIGSSDSSIRNVVPNDLRQILETGKIQAIYANGGTAKRLYDRFQKDACQMEAIGLPSTSPANAAYSLERLTAQWRNIL